MSLAAKFAFQVDKKSQSRGYALVHARKVRILHSSPSEIRAEVLGSECYDVRMTLDGQDLLAYCDCPAFTKSGPCKHLWAVILEADRTGALAAARIQPSLNLIDELAPDDLDDPEDPFDDPDDDFFINFDRYLPKLPKPQVSSWKEKLQTVARLAREQAAARERTAWPASLQVLYVIDPAASRQSGAITLNLRSRTRKKNGDWSVPKDLRAGALQAAQLPDPSDAELVSALIGGQDPYYFGSSYYAGTPSRYALPAPVALKLLPVIADLGRLWFQPEDAQPLVSAAWDPGEPWRLWLDFRQTEKGDLSLGADLRRGDERLALDSLQLCLRTGFILHQHTFARLHDLDGFSWIEQFRSVKSIRVPKADRGLALAAILESPVVPPLDLDEELRFERRMGVPRFGLRLSKARYDPSKLDATFLTDYGAGFQPHLQNESRGTWLEAGRVYVFHDPEAEKAALQTLQDLGVRSNTYEKSELRLPAKALPKVVRDLVSQHWHVEADGRTFRTAGAFRLEVASGIDWFELRGDVQYDGESAALPELLAALRRGDGMVKLDDGSFGMLPEEWLNKFAPLAGLGQVNGDHLRFRPSQAALLDVLLAAQPEVKVDEIFDRARQRLRSFQGVQPAAQPRGFQGQLRNYQLDGLGWIEFLRDFGFGGILADDMGVGKTAQVLAALEQRRTGSNGPSLVVAPRSLLFNWRQEAARFTPQLKVLEYAGLDRNPSHISDHHLVLTTYGTLQRDIHTLSQREFDYVILDEAQAIKNASTVSAKAVRLLKGQHRLALSGTPVENHLGELWSLFEFLNPGMLGEAKVLKLTGGLARNPPEETRHLLASALRPFILRRTKRQVASELPEKTEQTIYCELEIDQRRRYDQLRNHYRANLLGANSAGRNWNRMRIQVLEALLRLRQAACHTGLLDKDLHLAPSAKFTTLLAQLEELREEGHKALVFSQFTSLLALLRARLDESGFVYEYLDGATRDRRQCVERFQNTPECQLFLISLRAGGLGLNLTAASYVFLLDPWWNPAVEAQAIDRTHRIGQTRNVFAYRLIARDTVEEKVLELQKSKRDLADAILNEDNRLLANLRPEDLDLLLS